MQSGDDQKTLACETRACARRSNNNNDRDAETAGDNLAGVSLGRVGRHTRENGRVAFFRPCCNFQQQKERDNCRLQERPGMVLFALFYQNWPTRTR
jgi:hypothetical protein